MYNLACIDWQKLMVNSVTRVKTRIDRVELGLAKDKLLLTSAQLIYHKYRQLHSRLKKTPLGIAINRDTHRGQLIFHKKPILLPGESFIPIDRLNWQSRSN